MGGEAKQVVVLPSVFQLEESWKTILEIIEKARRSETTQRVLRSTLKDLTPLVLEIKQYNEDLDLSRKEIQTLIKEKEAGEEIGTKCFKIRRWCWKECLPLLPYHRHRLCRRDDSLVKSKSSDADKQALMVKDVKETLHKVRDILEDLTKENFGQGYVGPKICGPPENPEFTVGLDEPLMKLKIDVLRDGVAILGLTGLGGSGKTTLATKLCWDHQVRGKFRENILFVTFSKTPKLKIIVERLYEHCGCRVPEFQSDEDAVNRLGLLLRHIGERPILLVLDDVWPGSEALVEKFKFEISDYKILVTSRVAFPRFGPPCHLKPLGHEDAMTLFRHYLMKESSSNIPDEDLVQQVVRVCRGSPLALKVIGRSLSHQASKLWQKMVDKLSQGHSILDSNIELLTCLQKSLDVLEDKPTIKECFMDLGLFPEDQRIPVTALIDMWAELYRLDDDGIEALTIINKLASMNLADLIVARQNANGTGNYNYNNHFIVQHDLLRELAIYQSSLEPMEQRKRLILDINEKKREWMLEEQQSMIARILSKILRWCVKQKPQQVPACPLSISTDEICTSYLSNIQPAETEVLILNLQTKQFSLPESMEKMSKLKVLIVTNYGFHPSELNNCKLLSSLPNLRRIRLEQISVRNLGILKNLQKLSLYMCNMSQAFENSTVPVFDALPNLVDLNIDYCKDIVELPTGVSDIAPLKKLGISNCHKLSALPQEIGNLVNLEVLRINSCTDLIEIPDSIGRLLNLSLLDISDCISLTKLPEDIGNLSNLRNLHMTSCTRCELPASVINLEHLKVICDEETAASWEVFKPMLPNLMIEVPQVDVNLNWLHGISS